MEGTVIFSSPSLSKKGYGSGFVSKSRRNCVFENIDEDVPGPGLYAPQAPIRHQHHHVGEIFSRTSDRFRAVSINQTPGPADYNIASNWKSAQRGHYGGANLKSRAPRTNTAQYDNQQQTIQNLDHTLVSAHELQLDEADLAVVQKSELQKKFSKKSSAGLSSMFQPDTVKKYLKQQEQTPGPNAYHIEHLFGQELFQRGSIRSSSMFSEATRVDFKYRKDPEVGNLLTQNTLVVAKQERSAIRTSHPRVMKLKNAQLNGKGVVKSSFRGRSIPAMESDLNSGPRPGQYNIDFSSVVRKSFRRRQRH